MPCAEALAPWRVVLVSPQTAENVGAVARVMMNLGFSQLVIVQPRCDLDPAGPAGHMARLASGILTSAPIHDTLAQALSDTVWSVALTRHVSPDRPREFHGFVPEPLMRDLPAGPKALVFGREDRGLETSECDLCAARWCLPSGEAFPSFNLAQSAAIALAGAVQCVSPSESAATGEDAPATSRELDGLLEHLRCTLEAGEYDRGGALEPGVARLGRIARRARLTLGEARMIRGMCRRLLNRMRIQDEEEKQ